MTSPEEDDDEVLGVTKLTKEKMEAFGIRKCHYCGEMPVLDEWTQMVAGEEVYVLGCVKCGILQFFNYA